MDDESESAAICSGMGSSAGTRRFPTVSVARCCEQRDSFAAFHRERRSDRDTTLSPRRCGENLEAIAYKLEMILPIAWYSLFAARTRCAFEIEVPSAAARNAARTAAFLM